MGKIKALCLCLFIAAVLPCFAQQNLRDKVQEVYSSQIGVREATGKNDGAQVEEFLKYAGLPKGNPWCAAFVSWSFGQCAVVNPKTGYSPTLFPTARVIYQPSKKKLTMPQKADVFGIWFADKGRIAHVGFVDTWSAKYVITVEGNTNDALSRDGDGVYRKRRLTRQIYAVSSYIK